jgi:hypothetical protein
LKPVVWGIPISKKTNKTYAVGVQHMFSLSEMTKAGFQAPHLGQDLVTNETTTTQSDIIVPYLGFA